MSEAAERWRRHVAGWRRSGQTARIYAAVHGLSAGTLKWWSSRLGQDVAPASVALVRVERVPPVAAPETQRGVTLVWPALGVEIRVDDETRAYLAGHELGQRMASLGRAGAPTGRA